MYQVRRVIGWSARWHHHGSAVLRSISEWIGLHEQLMQLIDGCPQLQKIDGNTFVQI